MCVCNFTDQSRGVRRRRVSLLIDRQGRSVCCVNRVINPYRGSGPSLTVPVVCGRVKDVARKIVFNTTTVHQTAKQKKSAKPYASYCCARHYASSVSYNDNGFFFLFTIDGPSDNILNKKQILNFAHDDFSSRCFYCHWGHSTLLIFAHSFATKTCSIRNAVKYNFVHNA